jgi:ubiquinone/menaquinone biosynthesis C-methylase UbiE
MVNDSQVWQNKLFAKTIGNSYARAIERKNTARRPGYLVFGTDVDRIYNTMDIVAEMPDRSAVLDVPCGGGVALRRLRPSQRVRYVAMEISAGMLTRARQRICPEHRDMVEIVEGSIEHIPSGFTDRN